MSVNSFIPEVWGKEMLVNLRKALVFGNLVNRDYEGDIANMGDTVRINSIGDIAISSYSKDTDIAAAQALSDAQTVLVIDQAKYFNFSVSDVDQAQQMPKVMGEAMAWAAYRLADTIDQFIAGLYVNAATANLIGTSGAPQVVTVPTSTNVGAGTTVYDELVTLSQFLTQSLIPRQGRFCVIPPWCKTHLAQDPRFTSFNTPQARATIAQYGFDPAAPDNSNPVGSMGSASDAFLGMIENMAVYESVNTPHIGGTVGISGSQDAVIAGHSMAWTYADNVVKTEGYRPPLRFEDAVKGLHLYGAKVTRPAALAVAFLQKP